ncbi:MAG: hypothetical protein J0L97_08425 [Alphaproteobacteria bacterium]|nr:hypothetical protein [Alphaproteobacteria bacterium]
MHHDLQYWARFVVAKLPPEAQERLAGPVTMTKEMMEGAFAAAAEYANNIGREHGLDVAHTQALKSFLRHARESYPALCEGGPGADVYEAWEALRNSVLTATLRQDEGFIYSLREEYLLLATQLRDCLRDENPRFAQLRPQSLEK